MPIATNQGSAISAAKRVKLSPLAAKASRLVRLETRSSSEAVLDRWVQAYTCGLGRAPSRAAVANTTGVSSTIVASRLSTAVITDATANTQASSLRGRPAAARAIHAPQAVNSPSSSHSWARTSTAARKPITGPSLAASARAWLSEIALMPMTTPAAGTATTASGQPHGRTTAQASTASSRTAETASASEVLRAGPSPGSAIRQRSSHFSAFGERPVQGGSAAGIARWRGAPRAVVARPCSPRPCR